METTQTKIHELKTWPAYFEALWNGTKTFELRQNDRGFQPGDILALKEFDPHTSEYSGRLIIAQAGFILQGEFGLPTDVCVMSLLNVTRYDEFYEVDAPAPLNKIWAARPKGTPFYPGRADHRYDFDELLEHLIGVAPYIRTVFGGKATEREGTAEVTLDTEAGESCQ